MDLKRLTGRGAFDTIRAFILSLHISRTDLSAKGVQEITGFDVASLAQIPVSEDSAHPTLDGVSIGQPTKLVKMVEEIARILRETGKILEDGRFLSLGTFIIECAKRSHVPEKGVSASRFIYMVSAFV